MHIRIKQHKQKNRTHKKHSEIPFSSFLLIVAVYEVSWWSIGLFESPFNEFIIRENSYIRTDISAFKQQTSYQIASFLLDLLRSTEAVTELAKQEQAKPLIADTFLTPRSGTLYILILLLLLYADLSSESDTDQIIY